MQKECNICPISVILREMAHEKMSVIKEQKETIRKLRLLTQMKIDFDFNKN